MVAGFDILVGPLVGIVVIVLLVKLVSFPFWLIKNSLMGWVILGVCNFIGLFTIKITFIHCLIVGVLGIPGIVLLLVYLNYLK